MLIFDSLIIIAVFLALIISSISDIKTREVPDWISYGLIFFVLLTRGLESIITKSYFPFAHSLITGLIFFGVGSLLYYTQQWGGGDTKLVSGLGAAFTKSFTGQSSGFIPYSVVLAMNILLIGAVYSLFYAGFLAFKHKKEFVSQFNVINKSKKMRNMKFITLFFVLILILLSFIYLPSELKFNLSIFSLAILLLPYVLVFVKSVEASCMYKNISPSKLTEGDWIKNNIYKGKKLIYQKKAFGINKESIEIIKKSGIKSVLIVEGIPFVPSFLFGVIVTLILGRVIFFPLI